MASKCAICLIPEELHNGMAHKFSEDGDLIPVATEPEKKPRMMAVPDPALRALLIEKGIISYEELAAMEVRLLGRQSVPERPSVDG